MDGQEQVRLLVVRDRGAVVQRDQDVRIAREHGPAGEDLRQRGRELLRDLERRLLLLEASRPDRAGLRAAVARIHHDRQERHRGRSGSGGLDRRGGCRGLAADLDDEAVRRSERVRARRQVRLAELDRRGVAREMNGGHEGIVELPVGPGRIDLRIGKPDGEASLREHRPRLHGGREPQHDLCRRRDVDDGDLDRERGRPGRRQRPDALGRVVRAGGAGQRKEDLLEEVRRGVERAADDAGRQRDRDDAAVHGHLRRAGPEQDLVALAGQGEDARRRVRGDGVAERPRGGRDDELLAPERADRMRLALPEEHGVLLGEGRDGKAREKEDQGRDGGASAAVSQQEMKCSMDARTLARKGSTTARYAALSVTPSAGSGRTASRSGP